MEKICQIFRGIIELDERDLMVCGKSIRMKVQIDLNKPLRRGVIVTLDGKKLWADFNEQLPNVCYTCGRVGHVGVDCEDDETRSTQGNMETGLGLPKLRIILIVVQLREKRKESY